ncbi:MAG: helix-turn-helix transcriptional regulator [Ignavibacteria bacterium]|nr:helix-turn-helix transcriptional regulator [Ignavibacteria bacterium]
MNISSGIYIECKPDKKFKSVISNNWLYLNNDTNKESKNLLPENNFSVIIIKYTDKINFEILKPHSEKIKLPKKFEYARGVSLIPIYDFSNINFNIPINIFESGLSDEEDLKNSFQKINDLIFSEIENLEIDLNIQNILNEIIKNPESKISELIKEEKVNERTIQRKFKKISGISLKQFAMIEKFKESTNKLALEGIYKDVMRYYDQSNFINEFKKLSGSNPSEFIRRQNKLKIKIIR